MKTSGFRSKGAGFTLIEILVIICVLAFMAVCILPTSSHNRSASAVMCRNNQKQIAIACFMFQGDHDGKLPWQVAAAGGGSMEYISNNTAFLHYRPLSEYLGKQIRVFSCPADKVKVAATTNAPLLDANISYFLNLETGLTNSSILSGDRNLENHGVAIRAGRFAYSTNSDLSWTREIHGKIRPMGVLAFADGHEQVLSNTNLNEVFQKDLAMKWLVIP